MWTSCPKEWKTIKSVGKKPPFPRPSGVNRKFPSVIVPLGKVPAATLNTTSCCYRLRHLASAATLHQRLRYICSAFTFCNDICFLRNYSGDGSHRWTRKELLWFISIYHLISTYYRHKGKAQAEHNWSPTRFEPEIIGMWGLLPFVLHECPLQNTIQM